MFQVNSLDCGEPLCIFSFSFCEQSINRNAALSCCSVVAAAKARIINYNRLARLVMLCQWWLIPWLWLPSANMYGINVA